MGLGTNLLLVGVGAGLALVVQRIRNQEPIIPQGVLPPIEDPVTGEMIDPVTGEVIVEEPMNGTEPIPGPVVVA